MLVNHVVHNMLTHTMAIYFWHAYLLKTMERSIRNFIWSGVVDKRKLVIVAWNKICRPLAHGGISIRSIKKLKKVGNLKLGWDLLSSQESWA